MCKSYQYGGTIYAKPPSQGKDGWNQLLQGSLGESEV